MMQKVEKIISKPIRKTVGDENISFNAVKTLCLRVASSKTFNINEHAAMNISDDAVPHSKESIFPVAFPIMDKNLNFSKQPDLIFDLPMINLQT